MKKILSLFLLSGVLTMLCACGQSTASVMDTQTSQPQDANQTVEPQATQQPNSTADANLIGEDKAKEIALQKAGLTNEGVIFDRVELDRENTALVYEVEFRKGNMEYDADINATTGEIVKWETDIDD